MYELSASLADQRTQDAVAHTVAEHIQQLFQATLVKVIYQPKTTSSSVAVSYPPEVSATGRPDRIIPLLNSSGIMGEIQIWRGDFVEPPHEESRLLKNFASQTTRAFECTNETKSEGLTHDLAPRY